MASKDHELILRDNMLALHLWANVPTILRPPCERISPTYCDIAGWDDSWLGGWGPLLVGASTTGAAALGMWLLQRPRKRKPHDIIEGESDGESADALPRTDQG